MSKDIRKSTDKITYLDPIIIKGRVIHKGKFHKPFEVSRKKIEIKIQITEYGVTKIYNTEAWGDIAYSIYRRIKRNDTVVAIGQTKITRSFYSKEESFILDTCSTIEVFKNSGEFTDGSNYKSSIESQRKLLEGLSSYEEVVNKYFSNND